MASRELKLSVYGKGEAEPGSCPPNTFNVLRVMFNLPRNKFNVFLNLFNDWHARPNVLAH